MFAFLKAWFEEWARKRREARHRVGYDWARTALLNRTETPQSIEAKTYGVSDPFDRGATDAVNYLTRFYIVPDDRVT